MDKPPKIENAPGLTWRKHKHRWTPANQEMIDGYMDGWDLDNPEPSANRSRSYRHGFANARDDRRGKPRASFSEIKRQAEEAMIADAADAMEE